MIEKDGEKTKKDKWLSKRILKTLHTDHTKSCNKQTSHQAKTKINLEKIENSYFSVSKLAKTYLILKGFI